MEPEVIDTGAALQNFLQSVPEGNGKCPDLFIDLEGTNLSRHGTVSLLTVLVEPHKTIHIVDITKLGKDAFNTADQNDRTLKSMLESENIVKVFFDIRNDSDALFSLYGVRVAGVEDLQLMELASRASSKRLVHGLAKCIEQDAKIGFDEQRRWREVKEKGRRLFAPECGGSYAVFDARPLPAEIKQYCAQDVSLMPNLREAYLEKLCDVWWLKIKEETAARITLSQTPSYDGEGRHMAKGVPAWLGFYPTMAERRSRTLLEETRHKATLPTALSSPGSSFATPSSSLTTSRPDIAAPVHDRTDPSSPPALGVTQALRNVFVDNDKHEPEDDFNDDDYGGTWRYRDRVSAWGFDDSDDDSPRDLTACDKECGYCGKCMY